MKLRCFFPGCTASMATGDNFFRINATGQPGIWACQKHRANTDAPPDPDLDELVAILRGDPVPDVPKRKHRP